MGSSWWDRLTGSATSDDPEAPRPPNLGQDFDGKPIDRRPAAGAMGAALAIGAAVFISVTAPVAATAAAAAVGVGAVGSAVAVYAAGSERAEQNGVEAGAKDFRRRTVDGLIAKGRSKSGESRDAFFDKLEELYPSDGKQIREARTAAAKDEAAAGQSGSGAESGAAPAGVASEGESTVTGEEVTAGPATLSQDARE